jgi:hypothetical protein
LGLFGQDTEELETDKIYITVRSVAKMEVSAGFLDVPGASVVRALHRTKLILRWMTFRVEVRQGAIVTLKYKLKPLDLTEQARLPMKVEVQPYFVLI